MVTAINPDGIPGGHIDPDTIEASAARIATAGANVRNHGATVVTTWQRLSGVYEAPEDQQLFDVITPVGSTTTTVGDDLETVGNALKSFASEVRPIVARLMELKYQAELFVNTTVAHGVTVSAPMNAYQPSSFGAAPAAAPPSQQPWDENQGAIDRNNQLWNQVAAQQELLWAAERTCANKIRALYGAAALHSAASEKDPLGYGLSKIPDGTKMPWGAPAERTEGCAESSVKFVFKGVLWDGIVVGGLWGTIKGLGTLVLGYNPQTGDFFSGDAYGAAWSGVGMLAVGLATAGPASAVLGMTPGPVGDLVRGGQNALLNAGKGLIAWDKWQDDPGAALGESIFNIGTILIPAGAAVTGVKTAGMAARVLTATARVMDAVDPGAWAVKGSLAGIKVVVPSVVDLSKFLRGIDDTGLGLGKAAPDIRIPDVSTDTLGWHPDHTGAETPTLEAPRTGAATVDTPRVEVPPVREPALLGATPHTPEVHAPVAREPAAVGADTTPGDTAPNAPHNSTGSHSGGDTQVLDHPTPHTGSGTHTNGGGHTDNGAGHIDGSTAGHSGGEGSGSTPGDGTGPLDGSAGGSRLDGGGSSDTGSRLTDTTGGDSWQPLTHKQIAELPVVRDGTHINPDGTLQSNIWYRAGEHEYVYHTNEHGHIDRAIAEDLQFKDHDGRLTHDPKTAGKLPGDHAGHIFGDRYGGSPKLDNLVSQLSDVNLSKYKLIENEWARTLQSVPPGTVSVDMRIITDPFTGRPTRFEVNPVVNSEPRFNRLNQ